MYRCEDCGVIFETLAIWKENRGEGGGRPAYETITGCPCCRSTDVEEYDPDEEEYEESEDNDDG